MTTNFTTTLTEMGEGMSAFLDALGPSVSNFILLIGIVGAVLTIFLSIAYVIRRAIQKGGR